MEESNNRLFKVAACATIIGTLFAGIALLKDCNYTPSDEQSHQRDKITVSVKSTEDGQAYTIYDLRNNRNVTFKMVRVEGGSFTMGATEEQGNDAAKDESPDHQVSLSPYYIGQTEVTQLLWNVVMNDNKNKNQSRFSGPNRPVVYVSLDDCKEFINKLNQLTGKNFQLPTEAQWEYAARGGHKSKGFKYSGSNFSGDVAWYNGNSGRGTQDVALLHANELGLYDMSGNVWEWCSDPYGKYSDADQIDPRGSSKDGKYFVYRGGSWNDSVVYCRTTCRIGSIPSRRVNFLGFRLAHSL